MTTTLEAGRVRSMAIWGGEATEAELDRANLHKELARIDGALAVRVDDVILNVAIDAFDLGFGRAILETPADISHYSPSDILPLIRAAMERWAALLEESRLP